MPKTFLDVAYTDKELSNPATDRHTAEALRIAYACSKLGNYQRTLDTLQHYLSRAMSDRQFIRVRYLGGFAWSQLGSFTLASEMLGEAYERVQRLDDLGASALISYVHGTNFYYSNKFGTASHWYRTTLDTWHSIGIEPTEMTSQDISFEANALVGLGLQRLWLADYDEAERLLIRAGAVLSVTSDPEGSVPQMARIKWTLALIQRWQGKLRDAYHHAREALDVYEVAGQPNAVSRLRTVLADILLDIAESYSTTLAATSLDRLFRPAKAHLDQAMQESKQAMDEASEGMAILTHARYLRATHDQNRDRVKPVETAGHMAIGSGDLSLLGQAFAGRADELALQGNYDAATTSYYNAIEILTKNGVPALARWPRRSLLRMQEGL